MHIREVILNTASVVRTRQFYAKTLELPLISEKPDAVTFRAGNSLLTFREVKGEKAFYHFAFNITNNKFSESFEWMNSKLEILLTETGLPIANFPNWNAESFYFSDNNGSIIEFIARFDLPYYSPAPFTVADIKEISEIGIVTDDVSRTASDLNTQYNIPYFPRNKPLENFTVLGDDYGLMILTKNGRGWYPNHKPARKFPLTITADDKTINF